MKTFLTLNTSVPAWGHPGSPVFVYFDNGDWEIAFAGDVDYIEEGSSHYAGFAPVINLITDLRLHLDFDEVDEDGTSAHLYVEGHTVKDAPSEDVFVLYEGEDPLLTARSHAEKIVAEDDEAFNFVPVIDLLDDIRNFVARNAHEMEVYGDGDPYEGDDEEEER